MEWKIIIEGEAKKRILVNYDPLKETITFKGQYKSGGKDYVYDMKTNYWVDFSTETLPMNVTLEDIQKVIVRVYDKMNERLTVHEDLTKSFGIIQQVELKRNS